jgi:hypothetical protein
MDDGIIVANRPGAAVKASATLDGYDLSATLKRGAPSPRETLSYYAANAGYPAPLVAVRQGSYKLHLQVPQQGLGGGQRGAAGAQGRGAASDSTAAAAPPGPELYNLDEDPSERYDLAVSRSELVTRLRRLADEQLKSVVPAEKQLARPQGRGRGGQRF